MTYFPSFFSSFLIGDRYWWDWGSFWCAICLMASPTLEDARAIAEAAWTDYVQMKKDGVRSILNLQGCRRGVTQIG